MVSQYEVIFTLANPSETATKIYNNRKRYIGYIGMNVQCKYFPLNICIKMDIIPNGSIQILIWLNENSKF